MGMYLFLSRITIAMSFRTNLDFKIIAQKHKSIVPIDEMLRKIVDKQKRYKELSETARGRCRDFATIMAVNFVFQSSKAKFDDIDIHDGTHLVLKKYLECEEDALSEVNREYINYYRGLQYSHYGQPPDEDWSNFLGSGLLTVTVVCDVHAILLKGLKLSSDGGKIRLRDVQTNYNGTIHTYPPPHILENSFDAIIDRHNIHMECREKEGISLKQTSYIFKCAAWLLFKLVSLHPFYDGNGRLCRILANHVLSRITPFPVSIYNTNSSTLNRDCYLRAIVHGRENEDEGVAELASMLVESAYLGWNDLFQYLEVGGLLGNNQSAGTIVIKKSHRDEIEDRVKRLKNISQMEKVLADVHSIVASADTSSLIEPDHYILEELHVELEHGGGTKVLQIEIYS